jgi:amidophosphoribosyltransferase
MIVDDSIVRGTTSREIVRMIREHDAKEVYFASACPPIKLPCFYGIDIPSKHELIASKLNLEDMKAYLNVDGLIYQEMDGLVEAVTRKGKHRIEKPCMACMNGCYLTDKSEHAKASTHADKRYQLQKEAL